LAEFSLHPPGKTRLDENLHLRLPARSGGYLGRASWRAQAPGGGTSACGPGTASWPRCAKADLNIADRRLRARGGAGRAAPTIRPSWAAGFRDRLLKAHSISGVDRSDAAAARPAKRIALPSRHSYWYFFKNGGRYEGSTSTESYRRTRNGASLSHSVPSDASSIPGKRDRGPGGDPPCLWRSLPDRGPSDETSPTSSGFPV